MNSWLEGGEPLTQIQSCYSYHNFQNGGGNATSRKSKVWDGGGGSGKKTKE